MMFYDIHKECVPEADSGYELAADVHGPYVRPHPIDS